MTQPLPISDDSILPSAFSMVVPARTMLCSISALRIVQSGLIEV